MPKKSDLRVTRRIGARVRLLRQQAGLSIDKVAWDIGITKPHLSRIERGERDASYAVLFRLAKRLGVLAADLVAFGRDPRTRVLRATRGVEKATLEELLRRLTRKR